MNEKIEPVKGRNAIFRELNIRINADLKLRDFLITSPAFYRVYNLLSNTDNEFAIIDIMLDLIRVIEKMQDKLTDDALENWFADRSKDGNSETS
jgi:hypothetical protein